MSHQGFEEKRYVNEDAAGRRHEHVERREGDLRGPLDKAGDKIKEGWEKTKEKAHDLKESAKETGHDIKEKLSSDKPRGAEVRTEYREEREFRRV
ncbi:LEA-like protein [Aphelenchoides avenae]|nr:LEA-like protein [Aphelenchus avenae]